MLVIGTINQNDHRVVDLYSRTLGLPVSFSSFYTKDPIGRVAATRPIGSLFYTKFSDVNKTFPLRPRLFTARQKVIKLLRCSFLCFVLYIALHAL